MFERNSWWLAISFPFFFYDFPFEMLSKKMKRNFSIKLFTFSPLFGESDILWGILNGLKWKWCFQNLNWMSVDRKIQSTGYSVQKFKKLIDRTRCNHVHITKKNVWLKSSIYVGTQVIIFNLNILSEQQWLNYAHIFFFLCIRFILLSAKGFFLCD